MGPVTDLNLTYDRAGRSNGVAFVTYEDPKDAKRAIREFDGANAKGTQLPNRYHTPSNNSLGQPIHLILLPSGPSGPRNGGRRNPFDSAVAPPRSLEDRITLAPGAGRSRSDSPIRHSDVRGPAPNNVDRYVPGQHTRSRSPMPRRRDGRRPGSRRERTERGGGRGADRLAKDGRPKKTQEELDAEMEDYWGSKENADAAAVQEPAVQDDVDMIE